MDEEAGAGSLTDNEKAATFIGWTGKRECNGWVWMPPIPGAKGGAMAYCMLPEHSDIKSTEYSLSVGRIEKVIHDVPAPDMTQPENYMRALEALPDNRWPDMCLHENRHWRCSIWNQWNNDIGSHAIYWGGHGKTCGEAVVKALAALYDAEHPDV